MQFGVPLVTTPIGMQGLECLESIVPICKDARAFADAVLGLLDDNDRWRKQSAEQLAYVRHRFSEEAMRQSVAEAFQTVKVLRRS
jgi:O-antigen biosynthesis protein